MMYSEGIVASASRSKTQCPSGFWRAFMASAASPITRSRVVGSSQGSVFATSIFMLSRSPVPLRTFLFAHHVGGCHAGAYRAFDGRGKSCSGPVPGKQEVGEA